MIKITKSETFSGYMFVFPLVLILCLFLAYPIFKAALMSFQYWYMPNPKPEGNSFVGFENYYNVFSDFKFAHSVRITALYIIVTVCARFLLGLLAACLLNIGFKGRGLARALLIVPWAVPEVIACLVWILMYDKDFGIINFIGMNLHFFSQPFGFLTDPSIALWSAMVVNIWKGFPFVAIMLLAGLQSIPDELYEAATVDGAKNFQQFIKITLPMLKPVSVVVFLLLVIWTIKDFGIAFLLARGGPSNATEILTIYIYQTAFRFFDFGKASAIGMIMLLVSLIFTYFYLKILNKDEKR